jgi:hypothetical protein
MLRIPDNKNALNFGIIAGARIHIENDCPARKISTPPSLLGDPLAFCSHFPHIEPPFDHLFSLRLDEL